MVLSEGRYYFRCPYASCRLLVQVPQDWVRCTIFRCGVFKHNGDSIDPHSSREICAELVRRQTIWGCGRPFRFNGDHVELCGYI